MCGICGIIKSHPDNQVDEKNLITMRDIMRHRGPDDEGLYIDKNVGLGFRRLSIVDLKSGHQPMTNENSDIWIIFNGEIYNHQELRKVLISKGHIYKTNSDTESILHLYEEEGLDCFSKLNGMFGIAIWDSRKKITILARDRLGIKPLYYHLDRDRLIFASEIKALVQSGLLNPELNYECLQEYLLFRSVSGENTTFSGVKNLLPGHTLVFNGNDIKTKKYWELPDYSENSGTDGSPLIQKFDEYLDSSVKYRLMSDVPLGTFCSGGIDSSLTTALASRTINNNLNTFSVGFDEPDYDESLYALLVSNKFGTKHHTINVDNKTFARNLPTAVWFNDEPLNHANSVQIYLLSKLTKQFVTVVLTGEGSDELFGGYPRYIITSIYSRILKLPLFFRTACAGIFSRSGVRRLGKLAQFLPMTAKESVALNSSFIPMALSKELISQIPQNDFLGYRLSLLSSGIEKYRSLADAVMNLDLKTYLISILNRQDKMSMGASLEARVPFLDHRIVEWAVNIPVQMKIRKFSTKYIVKKLAENYLPPQIIYRKKSGFGVPISRWLMDKKGMGAYLSLLQGSEYSQRGYLNSKTVQNLVNAHIAGERDYGEVLWELISLEIWHRIFIDKQNPDDIKNSILNDK